MRPILLAERDGTGLTTNYIRLEVPGVPEGTVVPVVLGPDTLAEPAYTPSRGNVMSE